MQLHDNFVAKVVIFFDIHNKLSGNVVFFIFSAEFMKKSLYISKYTTNRPCEAVGVEEIKGLVQNAKGLVVRNAKWAVYKCQMLLMHMPINSLYE